MSTNTRLFNSLQQMFADIESERTKAAASPRSEAGSKGGPTESPVKNVDDGLIPEQTGSRYAENTADVKKMQRAPGVDSTPDGVAGTGGDRQYSIGVTSKPTGEDPANERDFKGTKDDPGTTSQMTTDDGEKYASLSIRELSAQFSKKANDFLATVAATTMTPAPATTPATPEVPSASAAAAAADGYKAAAEAGHSDDDVAGAVVEQVIKEAMDAALLTVGYLRSKTAADSDAGGAAEDHSAPGDAASGAGAAPMGAPAGGGAPPPAGGGGEGDLAQVAAMLQQLPPEEQQQLIAILTSGAAGAAGGGGGAPPMGGMPPETPGLSDAMAETGQTPESLEAAAGSPKMAADRRQRLCKIASDVRELRRSGAWGFKAATTAAEVTYRENMRRYLAELLR